MEILKDASAAAIYCARAANGVVLITTKQGKKGESKINFDAYTGIQTVAKKYEVMDAHDWITLRDSAGVATEDPDTLPNNDWQDEIFRVTIINSAQLSFLGGSEKIRYAVSGCYFNQEGVITGSDYKRYTGRINLNTDIKPWLSAGINFTGINSEQNQLPEQNEWTSVAISTLLMNPAIELLFLQI